MSNLSSAKGIVLRCQKFQESSLIVSIILTSGERISLIARGAMKSRKRFSGGLLEPTHYIEIQYKRAMGDRMAVLEGAVLLEDFSGIRKDFERMDLALFCVRCVGKVAQEGDRESAGLFNLLGHALRILQKTDNLEYFKTIFCIKLLFQQGVLDIEDWMHPFLRQPFSELSNGGSEPQFSRLQLNWLVSRVEGYLQTAGTHLE